MGLIFRDPHSNINNLDPIINEFQTYVGGLESFSGKPYIFRQEVDIKNKTIKKSIGFIENDTIKYHDSESILFLRKVYKKNIHYIDSVKTTLHFERNKEMFTDLSEHYRLIDSYFDYPQCDTCLVSFEKTLSKKDSSLIKYKAEYIIDKPYFKYYNSYQKKYDKIAKGNDYATSPQLLFDFLLKPLEWFVDLVGWNSDESVTLKIQ